MLSLRKSARQSALSFDYSYHNVSYLYPVTESFSKGWEHEMVTPMS